MYSKVGYNLKKPIDDLQKSKNKRFGRKESILDAFEKVANESHEEMLGRSGGKNRQRQSV